jgi:hypothetical protein
MPDQEASNPSMTDTINIFGHNMEKFRDQHLICLHALFHNIEFPDIMRGLEERAVAESTPVSNLDSVFLSDCKAIIKLSARP